MRIGVLVGNPKPRSRTRAIAEHLARRVDPTAQLTVIDLADIASRLFDWPDDGLLEMSNDMAAQDLLVVASPTYKASYSGMLKAFLDRYPHRGLEGVLAIPIMTISDPAHALGPDVYLRGLLVELGAIVPTGALAYPMPQFDQLNAVVEKWAEANRAALEMIQGAAAHGGVHV